MSTIKANNLTNIAGDTTVSMSGGSLVTTDVKLTTINSGPIAGTRNRIINGAMQIWQRGTSATGAYTGTYTYVSVDRWAVYSPNSSTTLAQSNSVPTTIGSLFQYSLKLQRPSGNTGTGVLLLGQGIESVNCYDLASQTITLSFWAKAGANYSGGQLGVQVVTGTVADQGISTVNSWTGVAYPLNSTVSISTTWTKYSITSTLGSGILESCIQFFYTPTGTAGADDSVYITGVQLEPGTVATPFERRSYGQELALCQRYYEQSYLDGVVPGTSTSTGQISNITYGNGSGVHASFFQFVVPKRTIPNVTIYSPNTGTANRVYVYAGSFTGDAAATATRLSNIRGGVDSSAYSTSAVSACVFHFVANAEL